ncbi:MAG: GHMP kinase [Planctomycetota bacterium]|nr:GHMP kinase [Planctomycetota bacterium]
MSTSASLTMDPLPRLRAAAKASGLLHDGPVLLTRAPGRLDVMGGVADYSGSLVCEMPLAIAAGAVVQARTDGQIVCRSAQEGDVVKLPVDAIGTPDPLALRRLLEGPAAWARYPIGCAWWLAAKRGVKFTGVTILLDSDVPLGGGVSSSAAIEVATMTALAKLAGVTLSPLELAVACQAVENHVVGAPCGVMDQVTSSMGVAGSMLEILCQTGSDGLPAQVLGPVQVPAGYAFVGIHSGVRHEVSGDPYTDTRVAAFMGQKILSQLATPDPTGGCLARVDLKRYAKEWRRRLPLRLKGSAFVERHGSTNDPVTKVKPDLTYAVQAATDHHVHEMDRVTRFVAMLKKAADPKLAAEGPEAMRQAGALMVESHHSYGKCAALGHAMTDLIVKMVMEDGPKAGLLGAKITGGGCGGTVAVLLRDEPAAHERLAAIRKHYTAQTGRATLYFEGSGPGAAAWGCHTIAMKDLA